MDFQDALSKAKIGVMSHGNSAFIATIMLGMTHHANEEIGTARTDGLRVEYNPTWFMSLPAEERVGLIAHEVMHPVFHHILPSRMGDRCPDRWNSAGDYVINNFLIKAGFRLPKCGLIDDKYDGMSTEQVYDLLEDEPGNPMPDLVVAGSSSDAEDGKPAPQMSEKELEQKINSLIIRGTVQAKLSGAKPGAVPGQVELFVQNLLNPKLPWHVILKNFVNDQFKDDYSFQRPNRRYYPEFYLPSICDGESLMHIAFAVDTSGSVRDAEFLRFISEIHSIQRTLNPEKLTVIDFDTEIRNVHTLERESDITKLKFTGRGGTNVHPVMDWAIENKPHALVIFSDGYFKIPNYKPPCPLMWLIYDNSSFQPDHGRVVHFEMD